MVLRGVGAWLRTAVPLLAIAMVVVSGAGPAVSQSGAMATLRAGESARLPFPSGPGRNLIVSVTGFNPGASGRGSEVVVRAGPKGPEIGQFGIFPNERFEAREPKQAMRFTLPIPPGISTPATLEAELIGPPDATITLGAELR